MTSRTLILISFLFLFSCKNPEDKNLMFPKTDTNSIEEEMKDSVIKVDNVYLGMSIKDLKNTYKSAEFIEEPVNNYGIDGEGSGLVVREKNERLFFVWTSHNEDKIAGIKILSEEISIDGNVHVGMKLKDFMNKYPDLIPRIDMVGYEYEYIHVPEKEYLVEFITTPANRVAKYDHAKPEPEFIKVIRPEAKIERISL